jgi:hypothetical protein
LRLGVLDASDAPEVDEGRQPAADVASARYARQVVELTQQPQFGQRLDDAEIEGGAADAAA